MKELLVLRHAKSSWKNRGLDDHDRPLNGRGRRDAPRMGALIRDEGIVPDRIVTSSAVRARTTAETVAQVCESEQPPYRTSDLYLSGVDSYVAMATAMGGEAERLLLVGHNPDVEDLVLSLTGQHERMPTAALARIQLAIDRWEELTLRSPGVLAGIWRPKTL